MTLDLDALEAAGLDGSLAPLHPSMVLALIGRLRAAEAVCELIWRVGDPKHQAVLVAWRAAAVRDSLAAYDAEDPA